MTWKNDAARIIGANSTRCPRSRIGKGKPKATGRTVSHRHYSPIIPPQTADNDRPRAAWPGPVLTLSTE